MEYESIHVRRRDKLEQESKREVHSFWSARGYGMDWMEDLKELHPLSTLCRTRLPRARGLVLQMAKVIKKELTGMKKVDPGFTVMNECRKKFNFIFGPTPKDDTPSHLDSGGGHRKCVDRYKRNIAGIADLFILAKSNCLLESLTQIRGDWLGCSECD